MQIPQVVMPLSNTATGLTYAPTTGVLSLTSGYVIPTTTEIANSFPQRATMWHDEATIVSGNSLTLLPEVGNLYCISASQGDPHNGDSFSHNFCLKAGTYTFCVLGRKDSVFAKIDWYIDGVKVVAGQDWYAEYGEPNTVQSTADVVVSTNGYHKLVGTINGKNVAAEDYFLDFIKYWLKPATDPTRS